MRYLPSIVLAIAIIATVAGGVILIARDQSSGGVEIILPSPTSLPTITQESQAVAVYITGAVPIISGEQAFSYQPSAFRYQLLIVEKGFQPESASFSLILG